MKLLEDEEAYRDAVDDFIACRSSADAFVHRFTHLWKCDGAVCDSAAMAAHARLAGKPGLYGLLDGVDALCETYARSMQPGAGYRVSAEQFRKEVDGLTRGSVLRGEAAQRALDTPRPA